jgi:hypothetical protein
MITAILVALSFNYPQAVRNLHQVGCFVRTLRRCNPKPPAIIYVPLPMPVPDENSL